MKHSAIRSWRITLMVPVITFVMIWTLGIELVQPAYAGTNGQQFAIECAGGDLGNDTVTVDGFNQSGDNVIWTGRPTAGGTRAITTGWWWKGTLTASYKVDGQPKSVTYDVPVFSVDGDMFTVNC